MSATSYKIRKDGTRIPLRALTEEELSVAMAMLDLPPRAPATWAEFHTRYLYWDGRDDSEWVMTDFVPRIAGVSCTSPCQENFVNHLQTCPPRWPEAFAWSVDIHNLTSAQIEKEKPGTLRPQMTVEMARARWWT